MSVIKKKFKQKSIEKNILTRIPIVHESASIKNVLSMLEKIENTYDSVDYIYVINKDENFTGVFSIQELFNNPKDTSVKKFMKTKLVTVSIETEIEQVAHLALKHNLKQIPVVEYKKLIGVLSSREILSTINNSLRKDIFYFAGIHKSHLEFENSMEIPPIRALRNRLSWLIIGLIGAMFMALYISLFENTLAKSLIIASFIPAIAYMSNALGTQFQTVLVRDLAILGKEFDLKKYFLRQMALGFSIATIIGVIMFSFIYLFWRIPNVAFIIALASFIALIVTSFTALFITLIIKRFKFDPALGSGPIATIISDITSIVIYFLIVVWLI